MKKIINAYIFGYLLDKFIPLFLVEMVEQRACGSIGYIRNSGEKKCLNEMNEDIFLVGDFFSHSLEGRGKKIALRYVQRAQEKEPSALNAKDSILFCY